MGGCRGLISVLLRCKRGNGAGVRRCDRLCPSPPPIDAARWHLRDCQDGGGAGTRCRRLGRLCSERTGPARPSDRTHYLPRACGRSTNKCLNNARAHPLRSIRTESSRFKGGKIVISVDRALRGRGAPSHEEFVTAVIRVHERVIAGLKALASSTSPVGHEARGCGESSDPTSILSHKCPTVR